MPSDSSTPTATGSSVSVRGLRIAGIIAVVVAAAIVVVGLVTRASGNARLREWTDAQSVPTVAVAPPQSSGDAGTLDLPGRLEAYSRASLYARVPGYLKSWSVDIGSPVKAGQELATIETPDLDQELLQSKANLATACKAGTDAVTTSAKQVCGW